ncbi:NAD(P)H-hydrate dehydratase [Candidatus Micrarchaeota archaeon]|nr:NAD(P)H-hydrate dehydratase [Candidatus Micrarchaeota archaeon]
MGSAQKYLKSLHKPSSSSHKGQNGIALIIAGGKKYHGSAVLSVIAASRFVDLLYFYSPSAKVEFFVRKATPCVICIAKNELEAHIRKADAILIGPGMETDARTKKLVHFVLAARKKCVLDASAIRCAKLGELHARCVLTPHVKEFKAAFGMDANEKNALSCAKKYKCNILLKGKTDFIVAAGDEGVAGGRAQMKMRELVRAVKILKVAGGNAGLAHGGTGDVLAGLLCALLCKNGFFASMAAASFVNKKAGETLAKKFGTNFSALDLANGLSSALFRARRYS